MLFEKTEYLVSTYKSCSLSDKLPKRTMYICKDQFRLRSNTGMDPGPRSPNNEFVECGKKS